MARWKNFNIWRGRLPHWRADGVSYYVTFRHRRELSEPECSVLFSALLRPQGKKWEIELLCVVPEKSELIVKVVEPDGAEGPELSDIVEKAKSRAGKAIIKKSGERFPPFYSESYDRIVRDEDEMATLWEAILSSAPDRGLCEEPDEYQFLFAVGTN